MEGLTRTFILPLTNQKAIKGHEVYMSDEDLKLDSTKPYICIVCPFESVSNYTNVAAVYNSKDKAVIVIHVEDEYVNDYYKFVEGKYSEFSDKAKKTIMEYWSKFGKVGEEFAKWCKNVFEKSEELKKEIYRKYCAKIEGDRVVEDRGLWSVIDEVLEKPQNESICVKM